LATSTSKKVLVERFDRETLPGFVNPTAWLTNEGLEMLTTSGAVTVVPYVDVKAVYFVREFTDSVPGRRAFASRPRTGGLWLRLSFRDGDVLEGVMPNNLLQIEPAGVHILPPDSAQRVFVPRAALSGIQVLGVVGSPLRVPRKKPPVKEQIRLFDDMGVRP
jgi:hypothetical protein